MKNTQLPSIVHVTSYYPPHLGGMENCAYQIVNQLRQKKYKVVVLASNAGPKTKIKEEDTHYLPSIEVAHTPIYPKLINKLLSFPSHSIIHLHVSQAFSPEIVYLVSKIRKIPYVAHFHLDVDASGPFGFLLSPYKKIFLSRVLKNAKKVIALTHEQKEEISSKYKINKSRIVVIPNGVGKEFFIKRRKTLNHIPHLLFVGRLASQKNLTFLIEAVSKMEQKVILDIVGDGEEKSKLKKIISDKKLKNVILHGKKTGKELIEFYKNADIFVLTSEREGLSLSVLDAAAPGLPVVNLDNSGVSNFSSDIGVVVKRADSSYFARALDDFCVDKNKILQLSQRAQIKAAKYSWEKMVVQIEDMYRGVMK